MSQFDLQSGAPGVPASPGTIVARIGTSSAGTVGTALEFDGGQQAAVEASFGDGPLVAATKRHLTIVGTRCIAVKADDSIAGVLGAVTQSGTGPVITAALLSPGVGPHYDLPDFKIKITIGGSPGTAQAQILYDGSAGPTTITIPVQLPAKARGTADLSSITPSSLNTLTFELTDLDGNSPLPITFTGVVTLQDVIDQIEAMTVALTGKVSIVGGKYLQLLGTLTGSANGSIVIGTGTANTILGFTNGQTFTGTDSTYDIPHTGVRLTFTDPGTYVVGETYSVPMTAPRASVTDITDAMDALRASAKEFGLLHIRQTAIDGLDLRTLAAAVALKLAAWRNAAENPKVCIAVLESPLGDPDDYSVNDTDVKTEMSGQTRDFYIVTDHGDIFLNFEDLPGLHRSPTGISRTERYGTDRLSRSAGDGGRGALPQASLKGSDGRSCRTEGSATVKLEDDGFSVLRNEGGLPYFKNDRTRAINGSQLEAAGVVRMGVEAIRVLRFRSIQYELSDPPKNAAGGLADEESIRAQYNDDLRDNIVTPGHASAARVTTITLVPDGGQERLVVDFEILRNAQIKEVSGTVIVVGESTLEG